jgi:hypothetical protein
LVPRYASAFPAQTAFKRIMANSGVVWRALVVGMSRLPFLMHHVSAITVIEPQIADMDTTAPKSLGIDVLFVQQAWSSRWRYSRPLGSPTCSVALSFLCLGAS